MNIFLDHFKKTFVAYSGIFFPTYINFIIIHVSILSSDAGRLDVLRMAVFWVILVREKMIVFMTG